MGSPALKMDAIDGKKLVKFVKFVWVTTPTLSTINKVHSFNHQISLCLPKLFPVLLALNREKFYSKRIITSAKLDPN